jgi:hypothetical protein
MFIFRDICDRQMCNALLNSDICHNDKTRSYVYLGGLSCDWVAVEFTHDEYCDMLLTLSRYL